jgi:HTH-type transcriptional regulator, competence development regulator
MKLQLSKEWFENRIQPNEDFEVGAGVPPGTPECADKTSGSDQEQATDEEFAETLAFGTLIEFMRRDRRLSVEQLASAARVDVTEIVKIEYDPRYVPHPRSVHQLARFFDLPQRTLLKLSNVTTVHNAQLRDAAYRFAANSSKIAELSHEERVAMTEFVEFLGTQDDD